MVAVPLLLRASDNPAVNPSITGAVSSTMVAVTDTVVETLPEPSVART